MNAFLSLIIFISLLSNVGRTNTCQTFYVPSAGHEKMGVSKWKEQILRAAAHPHFQEYKITPDSKGKMVSFLEPLIGHIFDKSFRLFKENPLSPSSETLFQNYFENVMLRMKSGELTYSQMVSIPEVVSRFFQNRTDPQFPLANPATLEAQYRSKVLDYTKKGIYPIPIFITPDFSMRTRLWALGTPPISIVESKFFSLLDDQYFTPHRNILHDWAHAENYLEATQSILHLVKMKKLQQRLQGYVDSLSLGEKEFAQFFLHHLYPELSALIRNKSEPTPSLDNNRYARRVKNIIYAEGQLNLPHNLPWIISGLHLGNVRFQSSPSKFIQYTVEPPSRGHFKEGDFKEFKAFLHRIRKKVSEDIKKIVQSEFIDDTN